MVSPVGELVLLVFLVLPLQKLLNEANSLRQSQPPHERSQAWARLKEEADLKRIVAGARKWYALGMWPP